MSAHRPGSLRFCNWLCHDGYREDRRHGLFTLSRDFAEAGCCLYCGRYVPTNAQPRASSVVGEGETKAEGAKPSAA